VSSDNNRSKLSFFENYQGIVQKYVSKTMHLSQDVLFLKQISVILYYYLKFKHLQK